MNKIMLSLFFLIAVSTTTFCQQLQPTETEALMECVVTDPERIPEEGARIIILSTDKTFSKEGISDIDGKFKFLVPEGKKINITVKKFGKDFFFWNIDIPSKENEVLDLVQYLRIKLVKSYVRGFTLDHLYFDVNKWDIKPEAYATLNKLYLSFTKSPTLVVEIAGHTDNVGDEGDNLRLSQRRADAIRDYLVNKGVSKDRILSKGYGEKNPLASNDTEIGRAKNRRTEVKVIEE
ncbi:MAG TPA: OmpA family protein [Cytophagaceae bacterium]|nr:OmpA family protein [Cytophagaceae bacterium]